MSEKDGTWYMSETAANYNVPTGYFLALIESAKLREAIEGYKESGLACEQKLAATQRELAEAREKEDQRVDRFKGFRTKVCEAFSVDPEFGDAWVFATMSKWFIRFAEQESALAAVAHPVPPDDDFCDLIGIARKSCWADVRERMMRSHVYHAPSHRFVRLTEQHDALEQLSNLATFIGHPGTTPAHVVSETVSLIEKALKIAGLAGCKMDQPATRVIEDFFAKMTPVKGSPYHYAKVDLERWKNRALEAEKTVADLEANGNLVSRELGLPDGSGVDEVLGAILIAFSTNDTGWRKSSENWQRRAMAAESQLAGPREVKSVFDDPEVREGLQRCFEEFCFKGPPTVGGLFNPFAAEPKGLARVEAAIDLHEPARHEYLIEFRNKVRDMLGMKDTTEDSDEKMFGRLRAAVPLNGVDSPPP
jgi:hypothetical protein